MELNNCERISLVNLYWSSFLFVAVVISCENALLLLKDDIDSLTVDLKLS